MQQIPLRIRWLTEREEKYDSPIEGFDSHMGSELIGMLVLEMSEHGRSAALADLDH